MEWIIGIIIFLYAMGAREYKKENRKKEIKEILREDREEREKENKYK